MKKEDKQIEELLDVFQKASNNIKLLREFLIDLLTPKEFKEIITRWQIIKQLSMGVPQRKIAKNLNVSIGKITRGSRELLDKKGGFNQVLRTYYSK